MPVLVYVISSHLSSSLFMFSQVIATLTWSKPPGVQSHECTKSGPKLLLVGYEWAYSTT